MKEKFEKVTDPEEIEELTKDSADLSTPVTVKPNGHLWAHADELHDWREGRK
jgi:hypothetical protein